VIGGGAAGIFAAIRLKELNSDLDVVVLESSLSTLRKVRISGGGRCNVTHHQFDPKEFVKNYPRGERELRGPLSRFQAADMLEWLKAKGLATKVESDGRVFPNSDSSQDVIDLFLRQCDEAGILIDKQKRVRSVEVTSDGFEIVSNDGEIDLAKRVLIATGSDREMWKILAELGHEIVETCPSLFSFTFERSKLADLTGLSVPNAEVSVEIGKRYTQSGPLLVTHKGASGPAVLKLSAFAAHAFKSVEYITEVMINWASVSKSDFDFEIENRRKNSPSSGVMQNPMFQLPRRLWEYLVRRAGIPPVKNWADLNKTELDVLADEVMKSRFKMIGQTKNKEEFVTAGGVSRAEIDFRTMESKLVPGLFFAGEVIDIDGVTGGFNFQNAWTTATLAAGAIASDLG